MFRIFVKSFDYYILEKFLEKLIKKIKFLNIKFSGPVPLPTKKERFNILRSPQADKDSRDQFEISLHRRLIDFYCDIKFILELRKFFIFYNFDFFFKIYK